MGRLTRLQETIATRAILLERLAGVGVVVGTLLPWATLLFVSVNGIDVDVGKVALGLALGAIAVTFIKSRRRQAVLEVLFGLLILAVGIAQAVRSGSIRCLGLGPASGSRCSPLPSSSLWL